MCGMHQHLAAHRGLSLLHFLNDILSSECMGRSQIVINCIATLGGSISAYQMVITELAHMRHALCKASLLNNKYRMQHKLQAPFPSKGMGPAAR